jgi:AcrR family transcriptional regulator
VKRSVAIDPDLQTRERLLEASGRLFAERGFRKVTVREICRAAQANVAAVNYHFGDKLGLYRELLQTGIDVMRETTTAARDAGFGQSAEEQLRSFISVFLQRMLSHSGDTWLHLLINRELQDPTPMLDAFVEQGVRPRIEYLSSIVAQLLRVPVSDVRVRRCVGSVQSQCLMARPNPIAQRLFPEYKLTAREISALADHISEFSLAGIRALARQSDSASLEP